jgi:hypothetical protein
MSNRQSRLHAYAEESKTNPKIVPRALEAIAYLHDQIVSVLPALAAGKSDTPLSPGTEPIAVPDVCLFTVQHSGAMAFIEITLPQYRVPLTQQTARAMTMSNPNALLGTIVHRLQSCQDASFSTSGGVRTYQGIATSHFSWPDANTFWRLQSSFDGKKFNQWSTPKQG